MTRDRPDRGPPAGRLAPALAALLAGGLLLAGCEGDELRPLEPAGGEMFRTYVSLGNSVTAGFQSGGINDSTQASSYAAMVAEAMGTRFNLPLLSAPGCPPPLVNVFEGSRVGGGGADACAGRASPPPPVLHNVAVPGAEVVDALTNLDEAASPNPLTTFILGGRTQVEAARAADPTFVSVWIGNNDVLGGALAGTLEEVTRPRAFVRRYGTLLDRVAEMDAEGAVLIGVVDATLIPHFSRGAAYWSADRQGAFPPTFSVDDSCDPDALGSATLVPFRYGFGELLRRASAGEQVELDCASDPRLLDFTEVQSLQVTVAAFNDVIRRAAEDRGWAFVDPNPALRQLRRGDRIPPFPNTSGRAARERPFGELFSKDGIHPARPLHRRLARLVVEAVNEEYGTDLPLPGS